MAELRLAPMLAVQRQLYDIPPGSARFTRYLEVMTGGRSDLERPLSLFNPMAKPHAADALDRLVALGAEEVAARAVATAAERLAGLDAALRVALVLVDDLGGGWTHRQLTEMKSLVEPLGELRRGWATVHLWTSESYDVEGLGREVAASVYRACHVLVEGVPERLEEILCQEGRAAVFAGRSPSLEAPALERARRRIEPYRRRTDLPVLFACLFGDDAARSVGYEALGLGPRWGFELACDEAARQPASPEAVLEARDGVAGSGDAR